MTFGMSDFLSDFSGLQTIFDQLDTIVKDGSRLAGTFLLAFVTAALIAPLIVWGLRRLKLEQIQREQQEVRELATLHNRKAHTPTMGGVIIILSTLVATLYFVKWNLQAAIAIGGFLLLATIGFLDDSAKIYKKNARGIPGKLKLLIQLLATVGVVTALRTQPDLCESLYTFRIPFSNLTFSIPPLGIPFAGTFIPSEIVQVLFLFFIFAGTSNAVNLTDGLDGLATNCAFPVFLFFSALCFATSIPLAASVLGCPCLPGNLELAMIGVAVLGALIVFLWHNAYPASVFMGDTGSLALGMLLGLMAFFSGCALHLVIAGGIFVIEALSDILQVFTYKFFGKRRIFKMAPIHHHFELLGWHENKITVRFTILSWIFTGIAAIDLGSYVLRA